MSKKVLIMSLLVVVGSLIVIPLIYGGINLYDKVVANLPNIQPPEKVSGQSDRKIKVDYYNYLKDDVKASGIHDIYETISKFDDTRKLVYEQQDFDTALERLTKKFDDISAPLQRLYYSGDISHIGSYGLNDDPAELLKVLDAWVDHSPESHIPYTIRGAFYTHYAWYFRGGRYANEVTDEGWRKFSECLQAAETDLLKAHELNPDDPEAMYHLITAVAGLGYGMDAIVYCYQQVMDIAPLHYGARKSFMNFIQPKWGGSWEAMEALEKDCEKYAKDFPILLLTNRFSRRNMQERGTKHQNSWDKSHGKWLQVTLDQLAQDPDDLNLRFNVAYMAYEAQEFTIASEHFEIIGDRYMLDTRFKSLKEYTVKRALSLLRVSRNPDIKSTPKEEELITNAIRLAPENSFVNEYYARFLEHGDDKKKAAYYAQKAEALKKMGK